jgi:hypothetical protein
MLRHGAFLATDLAWMPFGTQVLPVTLIHIRKILRRTRNGRLIQAKLDLFHNDRLGSSRYNFGELDYGRFVLKSPQLVEQMGL